MNAMTPTRPRRVARDRSARGLTVVQRRAAELLRQGCSQREVARVIGRSERTIRVWLHDVEGFREAAAAGIDTPGDLSALETLRVALSATRKDGSPDWSIRVRAAKALMEVPEPTPAPVIAVPEGAVLVFPDVIDAVLSAS